MAAAGSVHLISIWYIAVKHIYLRLNMLLSRRFGGEFCKGTTEVSHIKQISIAILIIDIKSPAVNRLLCAACRMPPAACCLPHPQFAREATASSPRQLWP